MILNSIQCSKESFQLLSLKTSPFGAIVFRSLGKAGDRIPFLERLLCNTIDIRDHDAVFFAKASKEVS